MDVQLKRGLLDICVLAAIRTEDSYGYQIIRDMKPYVEISESTLYPILRRLESSQLLDVRSITPQGTRILDEFQEEWKEILSIYEFIVKEDKRDEEAGIPKGTVEQTV